MSNQTQYRQLNRIDILFTINYKFPDVAESYTGECLNISGAGILFRGKHRLERGMALEMKIATKNDLITPLKAYVEVIHSKKVEPEQYEIATEIKGIREY